MHQNRNCAPGNHREHYSRLPTKEPAAPQPRNQPLHAPRTVEGFEPTADELSTWGNSASVCHVCQIHKPSTAYPSAASMMSASS